MAEENNLENEFDDNLASDDVGLPEAINDEFNESPDDSPNITNTSFTNRLKSLPRTVLSSRRNIILAGVVTLILILSSFFLFRGGSDNQVTNPQMGMGSQESPQFDSSNIVKKKSEKKKKKKIKYIDLYKQLEGRQLSPILRELNYKNISYNVIPNAYTSVFSLYCKPSFA